MAVQWIEIGDRIDRDHNLMLALNDHLGRHEENRTRACITAFIDAWDARGALDAQQAARSTVESLQE